MKRKLLLGVLLFAGISSAYALTKNFNIDTAKFSISSNSKETNVTSEFADDYKLAYKIESSNDELKTKIIELSKKVTFLLLGDGDTYYETAEEYYNRHKEFFRNTKTVYTIHNLAYQGVFAKDHVLGMLPLDYRKYENTNIINMMALGIQYAHKVTTVSPTYAQEILTDTYGEGLQFLLRHEVRKLSGILNGIDDKLYNPSSDPFIAFKFDKDNYVEGKKENKKALLTELGFDVNSAIDKPLIGIISRLASQKGMDLLLDILHPLLDHDV